MYYELFTVGQAPDFAPSMAMAMPTTIELHLYTESYEATMSASKC